jgi:hygromycin-B 7''-O-kinase
MKVPLLNDFSKYFRDDLWIDVAKQICAEHEMHFHDIRRSEHGENIVFLLDTDYVLKIYTPQRNGFNREKTALEFADGRIGIPIPEIAVEGEIEGFYYLIMTQLRGHPMTREDWLKLDPREQVRLITSLGVNLKELHSHDADGIGFDWPEFLKIQVSYAVDRQAEAGANPEWIERLPGFIEDNLELLPKVVEEPAFLHGDVHFGNLRFGNVNGKMEITGLFDFADSVTGFHEYEFVAPGVLMVQGQGGLQREMFRAYGYADKDIDETLRRRLMLLTVLYECSNLKKYALRLRPEAVNYTFDELEKAIWAFI